VLSIASAKVRLIRFYLQRIIYSYDRPRETKPTVNTSSYGLSPLPQLYPNQKPNTKMDTDRKLDVSGGVAVHYASSQRIEKEARQERKKGGRRGGRRHFPNYNADKSSDQRRFDKDADNGKKNLNGRHNGVRKPGTSTFTNARFSGPGTLEGLHRRHDQLEAQIKKMKKNIAKYQESVGEKPEHKTEQREKKEVASKEEKADEMELDV
jgi:hypothetical protein